MLLAIDIGNTNIVLGLTHDNTWIHHWRIKTDENRMPDEYAVLLHQLFAEKNLSLQQVNKIIISSVVPNLTEILSSMLASRTQINPIILNAETDTGIKIAISPANSTGSDIIANSVAAYTKFKNNCLVVDFGTATTLMAVKKPGILLGGAITAGLETTLEALVKKTSQLTKIELSPPENIIGNNTLSAMQSGLFLGHICLLEGMITKMQDNLEKCQVIATGGLASIIGQYVKGIEHIDPWLTLEGLKIIADKHK